MRGSGEETGASFAGRFQRGILVFQFASGFLDALAQAAAALEQRGGSVVEAALQLADFGVVGHRHAGGLVVPTQLPHCAGQAPQRRTDPARRLPADHAGHQQAQQQRDQGVAQSGPLRDDGVAQADVDQHRAQHLGSRLPGIDHLAHHAGDVVPVVVGAMIGQDLAVRGADLHACHIGQFADRIGNAQQFAQLHRPQRLHAHRRGLGGDGVSVAACHPMHGVQLPLGQQGHQQCGRDQGGHQRHEGHALDQRRVMPQPCQP